MVDHDLLHRELSELAAVASSADFDLHMGLHQLSVTAAAGLNVDGAGVTMNMQTGHSEYIAATDALTLSVEQRQDALQQGACMDAMETSEIVAVSDLAADSRWPEYRPYVLKAGFHAVAGVPVAFDGRNVGAINLYARESRAWTTEEFTASKMLADIAAGYLINRNLLEHSQTLTAQLQHALDSRVVIEQAKGVVVGRHGMTPDAAFESIRSYARSNRLKLHDVAHDIVTGEMDLLGDTRLADADSGDAPAP